MKKYYIAVPYSKVDMEIAFQAVNKVSADFINKGHRVFSPITLGHCITQYLPKEKQTDSQFWLNLFLPEMKTCTHLLLIDIGEYGRKQIKESKGCQAEINEAMKLRLTIEYYKYV